MWAAVNVFHHRFVIATSIPPKQRDKLWDGKPTEWQGLGLGSPQAGLVWKSVVIFAVNNNPCSAGYDASEDIIAWSNVYARREEGSETTFTYFYSPDPPSFPYVIVHREWLGLLHETKRTRIKPYIILVGLLFIPAYILPCDD